MVLDERYDFLKEISLTELEGKPENFTIYKGIKFTKDERVLLQFIKWKGEKFSGYLKNLIEEDMRKTIEGKRNTINDEELKSLIEKIIDKNNEVQVKEKNESDEKAKIALGNLMMGQ
ncbi:hypothetical protein [Clostridium perfringens]|uniref:hypothetical protein n=1 Tax=Clostridium perfringens TaxID=1502 RepID=UPI001B82B60B|nr:hypothetical protein [Clostridium perfringens]HBC2034700.1 hypothetical protein [Clostridium perfringens]HBC2057849.1 hypothetical protein [Clostridium perfringens]HBC2072137.1 hypothetical protein [Clostridium perfringens]